MYFSIFRFLLHFLHAYHILEKLLIKFIFFKPVKIQVRKFYHLDSKNKDLIEVLDEEFYVASATRGLLGFAESYTNGWMSIKEGCMDKAIANIVEAGQYKNDFAFKYRRWLDEMEFLTLYQPDMRENTASCESGKLFMELFVGPTLISSSGLFKTPSDSLETAQMNKLHGVAELLDLKPGYGKKLLDVGCGYGTAAKFFAETFNVSVVASTREKAGAAYAEQICANLPVRVVKEDCRRIAKWGEKFDAILALEVLNYIPPKEYREFFVSLDNCLSKKGLVLVQVIGTSDKSTPSVNSLQGLLDPGTHVARIGDIVKAAEGLFCIQYVRNIGQHYTKTTRAWLTNLRNNREELVRLTNKKRIDLYEFNFSIPAAAFENGSLEAWQILFNKADSY